MRKKIVIVSSSPRKRGNSDVLAEEFARGAREAGNAVEKIDVRELGLQFCTGCLRCLETGTCVLHDRMNELYDAFRGADALVFATPVYYYAVSGQLKTFLDRLNPLYASENRFRDVYLLAACADPNESAIDGAVGDLRGWVSCFPGARLAGVVRGTNADGVGAIEKTDAPRKAYETGKSIS